MIMINVHSSRYNNLTPLTYSGQLKRVESIKLKFELTCLQSVPCLESCSSSGSARNFTFIFCTHDRLRIVMLLSICVLTIASELSLAPPVSISCSEFGVTTQWTSSGYKHCSGCRNMVVRPSMPWILKDPRIWPSLPTTRSSTFPSFQKPRGLLLLSTTMILPIEICSDVE